MGVRTYGLTSLLEIKTIRSASRLSAQVVELANIVRSDVGNRSITDLKILSTSSSLKALMVNDLGAAYTCSLAEGQKALCV